VSGVPIDLACELLTQSLAAWRIGGGVEIADDGTIAIAANKNSKKIRIEPARAESMFRWMVTIDGRKRAAISLVAVLRQVREALDLDHVPGKIRVAIAPSVPS